MQSVSSTWRRHALFSLSVVFLLGFSAHVQISICAAGRNWLRRRRISVRATTFFTFRLLIENGEPLREKRDSHLDLKERDFLSQWPKAWSKNPNEGFGEIVAK
ncbi:hypothetical protein FA13DRAFT_1724203 [Coprinellus micaceus]|uniref:Uncharacterized protein n=1 Tax=Coprinellus micaceus TaxID=71717 RepID=A0A4Y7U0M8_COPMI|nr:hypothetical protein FA13DRAFT_1724203 [Coprinellus micaceus]